MPKVFFHKIYPGEMDLPGRTKTQEELEILEAEKNDPQMQRSLFGKDGRAWPVITAGAGLFSDGYANNSMGTVNTILGRLYGEFYSKSTYSRTVSSIVFAGTVLGMIIFGFVADYHSRKMGMIASTLIIILFTILSAAAWGGGGKSDIGGMLSALIAYRFLVGIGIGGEYPAGSVACSEASAIMGSGTRNRWFIFFTGFMIDFGFVVAAFVPLILLWIFGENHLTWVWRLTIGLGAIPPLSLFYLRTRFKEPETFRKNNFKRTRAPYLLALRYYGPRLFVICIVWMLYNFISYPFGLYGPTIVSLVVKDGDLYKTFGWNVLLTAFYLPGAFIGAIFSDWFGPRCTLAGALILQGMVGFIMAGVYESMIQNVAGFVVAYGIFLSLGELGPGGNIGLLASKNSPTAIRGVFYCIASSMGKIGAFIGTQCFPLIISGFEKGGSEIQGVKGPFWISSALCIFSACITFFFLPPVTQTSVQDEDRKFLEYIRAHGFDTSKMGDEGFEPDSEESMETELYEQKGSNEDLHVNTQQVR
ncbi:putative metabolite transport protein [Yarrowia sp. C11]|nr:putative metabolite transport protein [Yarrowia sp. E02]KAG5365174.1 putative metabolite transport protein [Yarrowia sp. C11]